MRWPGTKLLAYSELNRTLHAELARISAHKVAESLVDNLRHRGLQNQFRLSVMPGRQAVSLEQHAAIVAAIVAGDEQAGIRSHAGASPLGDRGARAVESHHMTRSAHP